MKYFGIKKPDGVIWWITDSKYNSWLAFFQFPSDKDTLNAHRLPISEAASAYESIGYKCVELNVEEAESGGKDGGE
jgi:hypothetical protein